MPRLTDEEITKALEGLPAWTREGESLVRRLTFPSFPDAIAFVVRLSFDAEASDHHPDVAVSWRRLTVAWSTHSEGGVTQKDVDGARLVDRLLRAPDVGST